MSKETKEKDKRMKKKDKFEIVEKTLDEDDIESILTDSKAYMIPVKREGPHVWSIIIGIICGVIGTHIGQYVERFF